MENSVDASINAQPEQAMSLGEFSAQTLGTEDYNNFWHKIGNFFSGHTDRMKQQYETYLSNLKNENEYRATQSARAWEEYMDSTRIQRAMKDYEKAGLNPYLAINQGAISTGSGGSAGKASYGSPGNNEQKSTGKGRDIALLILALAKVAAALM